MQNIVSFPGLGWEFHFSSVAFSIGSKPIYWYGIIIAVGFALALTYGIVRSAHFGVKRDDLCDMAVFGLPVAIICARIYYVVFQWQDYKDNLSEVIAIWHGGLAIYGGVIGSVLWCAGFCLYKKINPFDMFDNAIIPLMIGQSIGRWGNFFNCEAFGGSTSLPWRMCLGQTLEQAGAIGNHPTFFYESAWNALGVLVLHLFSKSKVRRYRGEVFFLYFVWYGIGRFCIEGLRTDSLYFMGTGLRISQAVAAVTCLTGLAVLLINRRKPFLKPVKTVDISEKNSDNISQ